MEHFLVIKLNDSDEDLATFPLLDGQELAWQGWDDNEEADIIEIHLGEQSDTTAAQEQYLNTHAAVASYRVYIP